MTDIFFWTAFLAFIFVSVVAAVATLIYVEWHSR